MIYGLFFFFTPEALISTASSLLLHPLAAVPESARVLAPGLAQGLVPGSEPASVPGLARESVPAFQVLSVPESARALVPASVPESVQAVSSAVSVPVLSDLAISAQG